MPARDGFELQNRDIELLHLVYRLGIATVEHLAEHSRRSYDLVYRRVAKLEERRYLPRITKRPARGIWQIGSEGVPVLIEHGHAGESIARRRLRANELKPLGRAHTLFIADIHAKILNETKHRPEKIAYWQQDQGLWDQATERNENIALPVRPDAYFILQHTERPEGKNRLHFFLEADRSTMSHERMAQKIRTYIAYHAAQGFARNYPGMKSFRVIVLTESRARAENLRTGMEQLIPTTKRQRAYRFLALADLTLDALLPMAAATIDEPEG
jgi:hypothetical protein